MEKKIRRLVVSPDKIKLINGVYHAPVTEEDGKETMLYMTEEELLTIVGSGIPIIEPKNDKTKH